MFFSGRQLLFNFFYGNVYLFLYRKQRGGKIPRAAFGTEDADRRSVLDSLKEINNSLKKPLYIMYSKNAKLRSR